MRRMLAVFSSQYEGTGLARRQGLESRAGPAIETKYLGWRDAEAREQVNSQTVFVVVVVVVGVGVGVAVGVWGLE